MLTQWDSKYLTFFAAIPLFFGVAGLVWSTIGASCIAGISGFLRKRASGSPARQEGFEPAGGTKLRMEILVAAFNEQAVIRQTLESLVAAAQRLRAVRGDRFELQITVGLDHCTDETAAIVEEFASNSAYSVQGVQNLGERGKWNTLLMLIGRTAADWVALVDSGSVWNPELLSAAWDSVRDESVLAVAPSYAPRGCGALEQGNWRLERFLKSLENSAGGPVSVHGATVLYRRSTLLSALSALHGTAWLNDDVVVPLTLRLQNPQRRIVYLSEGAPQGWVNDVGIKSELGVEYRRRRRMVMGNLQWIRAILLPQITILMIASRRVFRVFWAYWVLLLMVGFGAEIALALRDISGTAEIARALLLEFALMACAVCALGGLLFSNWVRRLAMAFLSGLMVSRYWKELSVKRGVSWV